MEWFSKQFHRYSNKAIPEDLHTSSINKSIFNALQSINGIFKVNEFS